MACIGCENYAKRVSNVYRDEEIKDQFESVIGYEITSDSFICDDCLSKLQEVITFRNQCRRIHEKYHPNAKVRLTEVPAENIIVEERSDPLDDNFMELEHISQEQEENYSIVEIEPSPKKRSSGRAKKIKAESTPQVVHVENVEAFDTYEDSEPAQDIEKPVKKKIPRTSWTVAQKLAVVSYAEDTSNREAARYFDLNESSVRCFRRQKDKLQTMKPDKSTNRHGVAYWPDLEASLKEWVNAQPTKPKIHQIQKEAHVIAKSMGYDTFSGSTSYIFKFMQRNGINSSSPRPRKNQKSDETME